MLEYIKVIAEFLSSNMELLFGPSEYPTPNPSFQRTTFGVRCTQRFAVSLHKIMALVEVHNGPLALVLHLKQMQRLMRDCCAQTLLEATLPAMSNPSIGSLTLLSTEKIEMPGICGIDNAVLKALVQVQDVINRTINFAAAGQRFVMVHSFHKKTQQTPKQELEKALKRMNGFLATDAPPA